MRHYFFGGNTPYFFIYLFLFIQDGAKPSDLKIVQDCIEMKNRVCPTFLVFHLLFFSHFYLKFTVWRKSQEIFRRNRPTTTQNPQSLSSNPTPPQSSQGSEVFFLIFFFFKTIFYMFLHFQYKKKFISPTQSQPPPSFHSALTSVVHTQKRQQAIGLPLLSENDIEEMIGVCKAFLAHKTQVSSQIQQVFVLFCFVLFCFVLFCFVLFCFVLFCFVLFFIL